jgi:hypothetical protein
MFTECSRSPTKDYSDRLPAKPGQPQPFAALPDLLRFIFRPPYPSGRVCSWRLSENDGQSIRGPHHRSSHGGLDAFGLYVARRYFGPYAGYSPPAAGDRVSAMLCSRLRMAAHRAWSIERQHGTSWVAVLTWVILLALGAPAFATPAEDGYIAGYASAVLQQEFHLMNASVRVENGAVTVLAENVTRAERDRIEAALMKIRGVDRVDVRSKPLSGDGASPKGPGAEFDIPPARSPWLPPGQLFDPLHADPRWPHFSAAVRRYLTTGEGVKTSFVGDFGETLALYRHATPFSGQWELGVQAGVFSLFDLGTESKQLVNADYIVGFLASYRRGDWSGFIRYSHQSSHLGDEFVLNTNVTRVNLSYEQVDAKVSYDLFEVIRLYGGGGVFVRREPADIEPWRTQYGIEVQSPTPYFSAAMRPVLYADFQTHQQNNWSTNVSFRTGVQFENARILDRKLQLLLEYYNGYSPNGQFYNARIETIGLGIHLYF